MSFWQKLPTPFFVVAPMADVTDVAFRRLIAKYSAHTRLDGTVGGPDVMWTEFVAADGLVRAPKEGKQKLLADLQYDESERPIVAQLFTKNVDHMEYAAALCLELGFDGVDINMGCPAGAIIDQGCGAAMIRTPELAQAVIKAAKRGAKSEAGGIPVSVKTRLGYHRDTLEEWLAYLLEEAPSAITIHARTRQEMSKVPARWERIADAVAIRDQYLGSERAKTRIIGNGDVLSLADAQAKAMEYGVDGVMVGRALFGNPWFFNPTKCLPMRLKQLPTHGLKSEDLIEPVLADREMQVVDLPTRLEVLVEHSQLFVDLLPHKNFAVMKKHYKAYVNGFPGALQLRQELMAEETPEAVERVIREWLQNHQL